MLAEEPPTGGNPANRAGPEIPLEAGAERRRWNERDIDGRSRPSGLEGAAVSTKLTRAQLTSANQSATRSGRITKDGTRLSDDSQRIESRPWGLPRSSLCYCPQLHSSLNSTRTFARTLFERAAEPPDVTDDTPIGEFLDAIASEQVAPAGGTVAAITAATGAALCEMVCVHTIAGMDDGAAGELSELRSGLRRRREKLLALGEQDAGLVDDLFGDDEEPSRRLQRRAAGIPLAVSEAAASVLIDAETAHRRGRSGVAADAKTGAYLADAAVRASLETVRINAAALPDRSFAADLESRARAVEESVSDARTRLFGGDG